MRYISNNKKITVVFKRNSCIFVGDSRNVISLGLETISDSTVSNLINSIPLFSEFRVIKHSSFSVSGPNYLSLKLDLKNSEIAIISNLDENPSLEEAITTLLKRLYE